jgi:AcrR family transcriptional regulator
LARKKGKDLDSKAVLVDAAWQLLLEQGSRAMSVEAIVGRAGLSKGTFFHFFPAKQDLLDALCARIADESWQHVNEVVLLGNHLDPLQRIDLFFQVSRAWRAERSQGLGALWKELARDENAALMHRVRSLGVPRLRQLLARLLRDASDLGMIRVHDVEVTAELAVEWISTTAEGSLRLFLKGREPAAIDRAARRANATMEALERILDAPEGSFRRVDREIVARVAAGVPGEEDCG